MNLMPKHSNGWLLSDKTGGHTGGWNLTDREQNVEDLFLKTQTETGIGGK